MQNCGITLITEVNTTINVRLKSAFHSTCVKTNNLFPVDVDRLEQGCAAA
jgi:hypothetical protein